MPEVSSTARGRRPRAVLETEGTVFPNTARPRPVNNIYLMICHLSNLYDLVLFADDINLFFSHNDIQTLTHIINS